MSIFWSPTWAIPIASSITLDEVEVIMRREPWDKNPRRWEGMPYIEDFALRGGYDLLIHGKGGPIPKTEFRYEQIPWLRAGAFPAALDDLSARSASAHQQENLGPDLGVWTRRARAADGCRGHGYFLDLLG